MEQDYWVLPLKDGTEIKIPAEKISDINKKLENREPIRTATRTLLWQDIAGGPRQYTPPELEPGLAEEVAVVFDDPILQGDEVACVWVKDDVRADRWNKYYANFAAYHKLSNFGDQVTFAYRLPIHMFSTTVQKCTPDEVIYLQNRVARG